MDFKGIRRLYLPLRPKGQVFAGTKDSAGGIARPPACGRWISHALSAEGPCRGHAVLPVYRKYDMPSRRPYEKNCGRFGISLPETRSGRDKGPPHLRLETISGRADHVRCRKNLRLSLPSLRNLTGKEGGINSGGGYGSPSVLNEVSHEFSTAMRFERVQTVPVRNSFSHIPHDNLQPGTEDSAIPLTTGHGGFRTRPPSLS